MTPNLTIAAEGKKFMWDGRVFDTREESLRQAAAYERENFDVRTADQDGKFFVYTRRVVREHIVAET